MSDELRNEINPLLTSALFSVRVNSLGKKYDGSWKQNSDSVLLVVFYLVFSSRSTSLSKVASFPSHSAFW